MAGSLHHTGGLWEQLYHHKHKCQPLLSCCFLGLWPSWAGGLCLHPGNKHKRAHTADLLVLHLFHKTLFTLKILYPHLFSTNQKNKRLLLLLRQCCWRNWEWADDLRGNPPSTFFTTWWLEPTAVSGDSLNPFLYCCFSNVEIFFCFLKMKNIFVTWKNNRVTIGFSHCLSCYFFMFVFLSSFCHLFAVCYR